jgi:hypothetical protein
MSAFDTHPNASHTGFPYYFDDSEGITFISLPIQIPKNTLLFYNTLSEPNFINCWCTRWDTNDYSITYSTFVNKEDLKTILNNTVPGAVGELYKVLGEPTYYDQTWQGNNTIRIVPNKYDEYDETTGNYSGDNGTQLHTMRSEKIIYVKNITTRPLKSKTGLYEVKIEGMISGAKI